MRPYKQSDANELYKLYKATLNELNKWYLSILAKRETTQAKIESYISEILSVWDTQQKSQKI